MELAGKRVKTTDRAIGQFMKELGGKSPVPGGGGAAALAGALGASLSSMVCALTIGKKKYEAYETELKTLLSICSAASERFLTLSDADEAAFLPLSKVYGMPRETEAEQREREEAMEKALLAAAEAPLSILELCAKTIADMRRLTTIGSRLVISDAGVAASMLSAGLDSAYLNVLINVGMMRDREEAERIRFRASELRESGRREASGMFEEVLNLLETEKSDKGERQ